jgi:LysM repeat protein
MKQKEKPASKIPTTQTNTNRKKKTGNTTGPWGVKSSLFKKNDTTLIIAGALIVTLLVFFVFFRSSGSRTEAVPPDSENTRFQGLEIRITSLEQSLAALESKLNDMPRSNGETDLSQIRRQVATLESGIRVQVDSLKRQMARLEEKLTPPTVTANPEIQEKKAAEKSTPPAGTAGTDRLFHTVEKGETLWRISQKYDITVERLRQLNDLAPNEDIYAGSKIRVR